MKNLIRAAFLAALFLVILGGSAQASRSDGVPVVVREGAEHLSLTILLQDPVWESRVSYRMPHAVEIDWMGVGYTVRLDTPAYRAWGTETWTPLQGLWENGEFLVRLEDVQAFFTRAGDGGGSFENERFVLPDPDAAFARRFDVKWLQGLQPDAAERKEMRGNLWRIYLEWRAIDLVPEKAYPLKVRVVRDLSPYWGSAAPTNLAGAVPWSDSHTIYVMRRYASNTGVLRHELFHTLWMDIRAPRWLNEGLARLFEKRLWNSPQAKTHQPMIIPPDWSWYTDVSGLLDHRLYDQSQAAAFSLEQAMGKDRFLEHVRGLIRRESTASDLVQDAQGVPSVPELPGGLAEVLPLP